MRATSLSLSAVLATRALARPAAHLVERSGSAKLINYVQTFHTPSNQPLSLLPLKDQNTGVTHINLASLHVNGPGDITLNDNHPDDSYFDHVWSDVKQLQNAGIKVLIMMGGAAQGSYQRLCGSNVPAVIDEGMYGPLLDVLRKHNIDGLDLDIEESVDISCALALLQRLDSDLGSDFLLTMAPVASGLRPNGPNLSGFDYVTLDSQATSDSRPNGKLVNWYNGQFYNGWGDASSANNYNDIISSGGWAPERVVLGVLDSSGDGGSGFQSVSTYERTVTSIKSSHSDFGGVVGWEYWDAGNRDGDSDPWQWVKSIGDAVFNNRVDNNVAEPFAHNLASEPAAPWPVSQHKLVAAGAPWLDAVWALNTTDGNLSMAAQKLHLHLE